MLVGSNSCRRIRAASTEASSSPWSTPGPSSPAPRRMANSSGRDRGAMA